MISIIVVCYNEEKRIGETLESIFCQTYSDYECIIVDGGSSDGTLDKIEQYRKRFEEKRILMKILSEPDKGIYDAMNKGVSLSAGNWINFMNSGDCFHDAEVLRRVAAQMQDNKSIVIGRVIGYDGYLGRLYESQDIKDLEKGMAFCHQAIFAKRELLVVHPFDLRYRICADYEWLLDMYLQNTEIECIDVIVADYDADGISNKNAELSRDEMKRIQEKHGISSGTQEIAETNWHYKLYKLIGKNRVLSAMFYFLYNKNRKYYLRKK